MGTCDTEIAIPPIKTGCRTRVNYYKTLLLDLGDDTPGTAANVTGFTSIIRQDSGGAGWVTNTNLPMHNASDGLTWKWGNDAFDVWDAVP